MSYLIIMDRLFFSLYKKIIYDKMKKIVEIFMKLTGNYEKVEV